MPSSRILDVGRGIFAHSGASGSYVLSRALGGGEPLAVVVREGRWWVATRNGAEVARAPTLRAVAAVVDISTPGE